MTMNLNRVPVGERVTIYPRGKKRIYVADFWSDGEHMRLSLRTSNKKIAMQRAMKLEVNLVDGIYHAPAPQVLLRGAMTKSCG